MNTTEITSLEYKNDFFSLVIRETDERPGSYLFFSGISLPRFDPICWGKTGICSNAAFKGLQQLRADVSHFAIQRGVITRNTDVPFNLGGGHGDGWYQEKALLIEDASPQVARDILEFGARDLVQTILTACQPDVTVPPGLDPAATQNLLESLSVHNYREVAPPPIAKPIAA
ncbi:MAG TPA: hypothetical protein VK654_09040 [Nitrospirota bacterium]|nr:hypothetical protein [Nitrospirota bacterium]